MVGLSGFDRGVRHWSRVDFWVVVEVDWSFWETVLSTKFGVGVVHGVGRGLLPWFVQVLVLDFRGWKRRGMHRLDRSLDDRRLPLWFMFLITSIQDPQDSRIVDIGLGSERIIHGWMREDETGAFYLDYQTKKKTKKDKKRQKISGLK